MSKLVSRIETISRGSPAPMGFGAVSRATQSPAMALIGIISKDAVDSARNLAELDADGAVLVGVDWGEDLTASAEALGAVPWGIKTDRLDEQAVSGFVDKGCDFFLASPDQVTVEAAKDDRAAFILSLPANASDGYLRALEDLPISATFTSLTAEGPLTLKNLIDLGAVRTMFDQYLLVEVSADLSSKELEGLRDMGVDAVVVDAENSSADSLRDLQKRLMDLPRQRKARSEKASAVLPSGLSGSNAHDDDEYE